MKCFASFLLFSALFLLVFSTGCGKGGDLPVLGKPSPEAKEMTPGTAQLGTSKFRGKLIEIRMAFEKEVESPDPLSRKFLFKGDTRVFAIIAPRGAFPETLDNLTPGRMYKIFGILQVPLTDKFLEVHLQP